MYEEFLQKILNTPCKKAWDGLFPSIFFEFGNKVTQKEYEYDSDWEFTLGIDVCSWEFSKGDEQITDFNDEPDKTIKLLPDFVNITITDINIEPRKKQTVFKFSNGYTLTTEHSEQDDQWYLLTPEKIFTAGKDCVVKITDR